MPAFIKICLFALFATLLPSIGTANPTNNGLMASNGIEYRLAPQPPEGAEWLQPGEQVVLAAHTCEPPKVVDWIREEVTCTTARVVRSDRDGITETGGVTIRKTELRMQKIFTLAAMLLVASAMGLVKFWGRKFTIAIVGINLIAGCAVFSAAKVADKIVQSPGVFVAHIAAAFAICLTVVYAAISIAVDDNERCFYRWALISQGLMAGYLYLV